MGSFPVTMVGGRSSGDEADAELVSWASKTGPLGTSKPTTSKSLIRIGVHSFQTIIAREHFAGIEVRQWLFPEARLQAHAAQDHGSGGAILDAELGEDVFDVRLRRRDADAEDRGDFAVRFAVRRVRLKRARRSVVAALFSSLTRSSTRFSLWRLRRRMSRVGSALKLHASGVSLPPNTQRASSFGNVASSSSTGRCVAIFSHTPGVL